MRHTYISHEFRFVCVILCYTNEWLHFLKFIVLWKVIHSFGLVLKLLNFFLFSLEIYLLEIKLVKIFGMFLFNSAKGIIETLLHSEMVLPFDCSDPYGTIFTTTSLAMDCIMSDLINFPLQFTELPWIPKSAVVKMAKKDLETLCN